LPHAAPESPLEVEVRGIGHPARVVKTPFHPSNVKRH
jgi:hypothetical protein